eukprot:Tamp_21034.p1 GENE.Tamp_21034~~Tamp_21034.p1  ORF type:complete len:314 (+),score=45.02 Tamp_21034:170-1111(+)
MSAHAASVDYRTLSLPARLLASTETPPGAVFLAALASALVLSALRAYMLGTAPRGRSRLCDPPRERSRSRDGRRSSSRGVPRAPSSGPEDPKGNVLLMIAHPDDEAMFFVPSILAAAKEHTLHVMSLSNGDYDGLGKTREQELKKSCEFLKIPEERLTIIDDPGLQDGPKNVWDTAPISFYLIPYLKRHRIGAIVTFDSHGVSGHPNHIALHDAIRDLASKQHNLLPRSIRLWSLESVGLIRKFMGPLAVLEHDVMTLLGLYDADKHFTTCSLNVSLVRRCLQAHRSQAVWYRWLFIFLSRYTFYNRLVPIRK